MRDMVCYLGPVTALPAPIRVTGSLFGERFFIRKRGHDACSDARQSNSNHCFIGKLAITKSTTEDETDMTPEMPLGENTFIVELVDDEASPDMPSGSLCAFGHYDGPCTDGELVLTFRHAPAASDLVSYSIRRYREDVDDNEGLPFHRSWLESLKVQGRIENCNCQEVIVGRFLCLLE